MPVICELLYIVGFFFLFVTPKLGILKDFIINKERKIHQFQFQFSFITTVIFSMLFDTRAVLFA